MTNQEFSKHKDQWCERCRFNTRRGGGCPILGIMIANPNDVVAMRLFRTGKCIQWEQKPERQKRGKHGAGNKAKDAGNKAKANV